VTRANSRGLLKPTPATQQHRRCAGRAAISRQHRRSCRSCQSAAKLGAGQYQPIGHAHDGVRHRIAEIRPHQPGTGNAARRERPQPQQRIDDEPNRFHVDYGVPNSAASSAERRSAAATAWATVARRPPHRARRARPGRPPWEFTCSRNTRGFVRWRAFARRRMPSQGQLVRQCRSAVRARARRFERFHEQKE